MPTAVAPTCSTSGTKEQPNNNGDKSDLAMTEKLKELTLDSSE
ncbi:hypothetical protein A2U01_0072820, partial [Trifolium medium]|nr:hypothetical protein [Trifolium medium]